MHTAYIDPGAAGPDFEIGEVERRPRLIPRVGAAAEVAALVAALVAAVATGRRR